MTDPLVTVGGPPGSGKTTAGRGAARALGLDYRSAGELFREAAKRLGMDLSAFSRYAEQHESVDRELDETMIGLARPGRLLDGRLVGAMCRRRGISTIYLVVTAREEVRIDRLAQRDRLSLGEAARLTLEREESERDRYRRFYGIDLALEEPDLLIDSSDVPAERVAERIVEFVRSHRSAPVPP